MRASKSKRRQKQKRQKKQKWEKVESENPFLTGRVCVPRKNTGFFGKWSEGICRAEMRNADKYGIRGHSMWRYTSVEREGLRMVRLEGGMRDPAICPCGFINKDGTIAITPRFMSATDFKEGRSLVQVEVDRGFIRNSPLYDVLYGFIDTDGNYVVEPQYHLAREFSDGMAAVYDDVKWGYVNLEGLLVILPTFDDADVFKDGKAKVKKNGREFYINRKGEEIA